VTATYPARTDRAYRGVIYGYDVLDHETGLVVPNDYRGKTRQRGKLRELQHRERQQFADRIVGSANVLWEGICTDEELAEMERRFIQDAEVRPRLNVEMNEDNPHRIPKWKQIEQRHERDRAASRPLWVPYEQRDRSSLLEWDTPDRPAYERANPVRQRSLTLWQKVAIVWGSAWLTLWIAGWVFDAHKHLTQHPCRDSAIAAAILLCATAVWLWLGRPIRPRTWKRRIRRKLPKVLR
jgi:hypothetical protein